MSIYETIGMLWVIFTSLTATIGFFYLAFNGMRHLTVRPPKTLDGLNLTPEEITHMVKLSDNRARHGWSE